MSQPRPFVPYWKRHTHPTIPKHTPVLSRSGRYRGWTLGGCQPCPAKGCIATYGPLLQIAVQWETGDITVICPVGVQPRAERQPWYHLRIIAGGEITARYVTPRDPSLEKSVHIPAEIQFDWAAAGWNPDAAIFGHARPPVDDPESLFAFTGDGPEVATRDLYNG